MFVRFAVWLSVHQVLVTAFFNVDDRPGAGIGHRLSLVGPPEGKWWEPFVGGGGTRLVCAHCDHFIESPRLPIKRLFDRLDHPSTTGGRFGAR